MNYALRTHGLTLDNISAHYVEDDNGCWNWSRSRFACGYGAKTIGGKQFYAHRLSYELHIGPIPKGFVVMHECDNRACINPLHLRADTQRENLMDARRKGRMLNDTNQPKGEAHYRAKLTEEAVRCARLYWTGGASIRSLARRYGVHRSTMEEALRGTRWKCVS